MNLKILSLTDPGIADKERLILRVLNADNIGGYLVFNTIEATPGSISTNPKNVYWFPDKEVKPGDLVVLYSRSGTPSQRTKEDGTNIFFFYWGLPNPIWNSANDAAAILKIDSWEYKVRI